MARLRNIFSYIDEKTRQKLIAPEFIAKMSSRGRQALYVMHKLQKNDINHVIEVGSGIGGTSLLLAKNDFELDLIEGNETISGFLRYNLKTIGCLTDKVRVHNEDWTYFDKVWKDVPENAIFIDP